MRILICDDEADIIQQLKTMIAKYFDSHSLSKPEIISYSCGEDLLSDTGEKDIVFLDIEMSGINGIYVGNKLKLQNKKIIIIIVTYYSTYLDDAMNFNVFRYLSKPLEKQRVFNAIKAALKQYSTTSGKVVVETNDGAYTITISDIICIEILLRKVVVHTINSDYVSVNNIQYWKDTLNSSSFFSPHRSYIVNFEHICKFEHHLIYLYNNKYTSYISRNKYKEFKDKYFLYLESTR